MLTSTHGSESYPPWLEKCARIGIHIGPCEIASCCLSKTSPKEVQEPGNEYVHTCRIERLPSHCMSMHLVMQHSGFVGKPAGCSRQKSCHRGIDVRVLDSPTADSWALQPSHICSQSAHHCVICPCSRAFTSGKKECICWSSRHMPTQDLES